MAKNTATGCGTLLVVALLMGGCIQLFSGDDEPAATPPAPVRIPDWSKKTLVEAENEAEALGLKMSSDSAVIGGYCGDETDCTVHKTVPKAGTVVKVGARVAVKFLTGAERSFYRKHPKMPNTVGWSEDRADNLFEPVSGAVDSNTYKETSSIPVGAHRVLSQSPKSGKPLKIGQEVKLIIGVNYGTTSGGGGGGDVDINVGNGNDGGESRFCSGRWWC